jgi:hypothetical protein
MENKNQKPYENLQYGFDRTQVYKEYTHPQHIRQSAMIAVMEFCKMNGLKLSTKETLTLVNKYVLFVETGDSSWASKVDEYIKNKYSEENINY